MPVRDAIDMRTLHLANPPMRGLDVKDAQGLLLHNPYGRFECGGIDGVFGPATAAATHQAKYELGYPDARVDSLFGSRLRAILRAERPLPDTYAGRREAREQVVRADALIRAKIVGCAEWGCAHEAQIHYPRTSADRVRPMNGLDMPRRLPLMTDCSGFVTCCYKWAGAPDPNGRGFDGYGWTGDMIVTGRQIARAALKPGDLLVFGGPATKQHVCVVTHTGIDPLLVSHGQERGPLSVRFSHETRAHRGQPIYWLAFLH